MPGISRGGLYHKPSPVSDTVLNLMHRIEERHMEFYFAGSGRVQRRAAGCCQAGDAHRHQSALSKAKALTASTRGKTYPCLLIQLPTIQPKPASVMDIAYTPATCGSICLAAVPDWFIRRLVAW